MATLGTTVRSGLSRARSTKRPSLLWLVLIAVGFLVLMPIGILIFNSLDVSAPGQSYKLGLDHYKDAWSDPQVRPALWNTIKIVFVRMSIGFAISVFLAWLVTRTNIPFASWLEFGFWISFFMPGLAVIQGWIFLLEGETGVLNQGIAKLPFIDSSPFDVFSFWGIIWVHLMSAVISTLFVLLALSFRNMDAQLEEAARVSGASIPDTARRVTLPLMRPILGMLVVLAIIRGMQSFEVERVLGQPIGIDVFATVVVEMINGELPRIEQGIALSVIILLILLPLIFVQRFYVGRRQYTTVSSRMRPNTTDLGRWRWPAFALVTFVILLLTVVPALSIIAGSLMTRWGFFDIENVWTLTHWKSVLSSDLFLESFITTLRLAIISAFTAMILLFVVAYVLVRSTYRGKPILDFISWLPWAIPGVLMSLGILIMVLDIPALRFMHGTTFVLIMAVILFRFPLGVHLLKTGIMQVSKELEEAGQMSGARWWYIQLRIVRPILMPMLLGVGLITFVAAMNEVSGIILLASVETRTLSLLTLDFLIGAGGSKEAAAVLTIVTMFIAIGAVLVGRRFGLKLTTNA